MPMTADTVNAVLMEELNFIVDYCCRGSLKVLNEKKKSELGVRKGGRKMLTIETP